MRSYHTVRQYPHKPTKADPWPTVQYASRFDSAMMKYLTIQDSTATSVWRLWNFVRVLQLCKIQSRNREIVLVDTLASGISPPLPPTVTCLPWTSTYDTLVSITTIIRSTVSTDLDYKFKLRLHLLGVTFSAKNKGAITNCHEQLELEREFGHQNASYIPRTSQARYVWYLFTFENAARYLTGHARLHHCYMKVWTPVWTPAPMLLSL